MMSQEASNQKKTRALILWGSQGETGQSLAENMAERFRSNDWWCDAVSVENYKSLKLRDEPFVLVIAPNQLEGELNGKSAEFWTRFLSEEQDRLENTKFAVLALGDHDQGDSPALGKRLDARFEQLGAQRVHQRMECRADSPTDAEKWFSDLVPKLYEFSFDTFAREISADAKASEKPADSASPPPAVPAEAYGKKNPFPATLLVNRRLNKEGAFKDTRHLEYSLEGSGFSYEPGDVLATLPHNDPELVDEMLGVLPFNTDKPVQLKDGPPIPLRQALIENLDIRTVSKSILAKWTAKSYHPHLHAIAGDAAAVDAFIEGIEVIDLLWDYPVEFKDGQEFVDLLRKLNPRLYSIASSPKAHPGEVHLTIAKVSYESKGRSRKGVASHFLCDRMVPGDKVRVFLQVSKHFRLPHDPSTDVIMVGPGTGVAPFRAFLEQRAYDQAPGRNWLFFGNPYRETDFFYEDELNAFLQKGVLTRLDLAWSRDQDRKIYVQDKMREARSELWRWIDGGAHFYVCGDASRMAGDVDKALRETVQIEGGRSEEEANAYVDQMKKDHRYQRDVY